MASHTSEPSRLGASMAVWRSAKGSLRRFQPDRPISRQRLTVTRSSHAFKCSSSLNVVRSFNKRRRRAAGSRPGAAPCRPNGAWRARGTRRSAGPRRPSSRRTAGRPFVEARARAQVGPRVRVLVQARLQERAFPLAPLRPRVPLRPRARMQLRVSLHPPFRTRGRTVYVRALVSPPRP